MKVKHVLPLILALVIALISPVTSIEPASAMNACNQRESYDSNWCNFFADEVASPDLYSCQDSWGYKGKDRLWYVGFDTPGNGLLTRGSDLKMTVQLIQDCRAWVNAYKISVTLVAENGDTYSSENQISTFLYSNRSSAPILSYCSTSTCGTAIIEGVIKIPANAPTGKYQVKIRISPWGSTSTSDGKTTLMKGYLSTFPQARFIPAMSKVELAVAPEGQISCYITDFVDSAVSAFSITGSDWEILEDNKVIDSYSNFPIATSDNSNILRLTHGYLMSKYLDSVGTRIYAYSVANQKIGSTYECRAAVSTKYGSGASAKNSVKSLVQTVGLDVVAKATPSPTPAIKTIYCKKAKVVKAIKGAKPACPKGYIRVKTAKG